jgi:hypothetical protein
MKQMYFERNEIITNIIVALLAGERKRMEGRILFKDLPIILKILFSKYHITTKNL